MDNTASIIHEIIGRLYLESQLELYRFNNELAKVRKEKDELIKLLGNERGNERQPTKPIS